MTDNSKHLILHNQESTNKKIKAVKEAVAFCLYNGEEINFNRIAKKAQVSRSFVYNKVELRNLIEESKPISKIRAERKRVASGQARSEESKREVIRTLKRQLSEKAKEIELLKSDNMKLRSYIEELEDY